MIARPVAVILDSDELHAIRWRAGLLGALVGLVVGGLVTWAAQCFLTS